MLQVGSLMRQAASVRVQPQVQVSEFSCLSAAARAAGDSRSRSTPGIFVAWAAFLMSVLVSSSHVLDRRVDLQAGEEPRLALGRVRIEHPDVLLDDPHVAIDDERCRQRVDAGEDLLDFRRRHHDGVIHVLVGGELPHGIRPDLVLRHPDNLQLIAVLVLQRDQIRNLSAARRTPRGPEVDDRHLPPATSRWNRVPVDVANRKGR